MKKGVLVVCMFLLLILFIVGNVSGFKITKGQIIKSKDKAEVVDSNFDRVIIELDKKLKLLE